MVGRWRCVASLGKEEGFKSPIQATGVPHEADLFSGTSLHGLFAVTCLALLALIRVFGDVVCTLPDSAALLALLAFLGLLRGRFEVAKLVFSAGSA